MITTQCLLGCSDLGLDINPVVISVLICCITCIICMPPLTVEGRDCYVFWSYVRCLLTPILREVIFLLGGQVSGEPCHEYFSHEWALL